MNNYIGNRGYTIYKNTIDVNEELKLKKELTVKPFVPKLMKQTVKPFPIYRESTSKYYLPIDLIIFFKKKFFKKLIILFLIILIMMLILK